MGILWYIEMCTSSCQNASPLPMRHNIHLVLHSSKALKQDILALSMTMTVSPNLTCLNTFLHWLLRFSFIVLHVVITTPLKSLYNSQSAKVTVKYFTSILLVMGINIFGRSGTIQCWLAIFTIWLCYANFRSSWL